VGAADGVYCFEVEDASGCSGFFCDTLGVVSNVDGLQSGSFDLMPNPASGAVQLNLPSDWEVKSVVISDASGREVATAVNTSRSTLLNVDRMAPGMYFVKVLHQKGAAIERLIVRR
jgi:hypothetical protein